MTILQNPIQPRSRPQRESTGQISDTIALGVQPWVPAKSLPGVGGAVGEGLLGIYQTAEGLHAKDHENTVAGITQFGVSVGMGMLSEGYEAIVVRLPRASQRRGF